MSKAPKSRLQFGRHESASRHQLTLSIKTRGKNQAHSWRGAKLKASRTVEKLLESYPAVVQTLASTARKTLRNWLPGVEEEADSSAPVIGYGYGLGYRGIVCTLILSKSGVKLGLV